MTRMSPRSAPFPQNARIDARLALVTVSYHSGDALQALLASLERSTVLPAHTIVVDNAGEGAELAASAKSLLPGFEIIDAGGNLGYGGGVNKAVGRLADVAPEVEWIVIANPDSAVASGALETLLAVGDEHADAASLGPLIFDPDGEVYPSARELPSLVDGVGHALFANVWHSNPWTRRYHGTYRRTGSAWRETGWLSGSFLMVRRAAFEAIDGFDEGFFMYFEDVDLGRRFGEAGWRNLYVPGARVSHEGAHSTGRSPETALLMRREHHRSAYRYLSRQYSAWYDWPLRKVLRAALALRARVTELG